MVSAWRQSGVEHLFASRLCPHNANAPASREDSTRGGYRLHFSCQVSHPWPGHVPAAATPVAGTFSLGLVTCIRPTTSTLALPAPAVNCPDTRNPRW